MEIAWESGYVHYDYLPPSFSMMQYHDIMDYLEYKNTGRVPDHSGGGVLDAVRAAKAEQGL